MPPNLPNVVQESPLGMLIEDRIHKTRRQVKGVDIIAGLMTLAVGTLVYLFAAAIIDHWLVTGGLGFWGRLSCWLFLISADRILFLQISLAVARVEHQSRLCSMDYRTEQTDSEK